MMSEWHKSFDFAQVEASTEGISKEVANVHKDVTAILNLLQHSSKLHHYEECHSGKDSPPAASHPIDDASSASYQIPSVAASAPESQGQRKVPPSGYQNPRSVESKLLAPRRQSRDISATATIVFGSAERGQLHPDASRAAAAQAAVQAGAVANGCNAALGEGVGSGPDSSSVEMSAPAETTGWSSSPAGRDPEPILNASSVTAPISSAATSETESRAIASTQAALQADEPEIGPGASPGSVHVLAPSDQGGAGNLVRRWKSFRSGNSPEILRGRRSVQLQEGARLSENGVDSRQDPAAVDAATAADDQSPQPRRMSRGRWASSSTLRAGLGDASAGPASATMEPRSPA